jgi:sulfide:quinone oxidoreductase
MTSAGKKLVIIGSSFGGVNTAYFLQHALGKDGEITLISREREFTFFPSLPWVIMGWRDPAQIRVDVVQPLRRRRINFVHSDVISLDASANEVRTEQARFGYDVLIIASGAELDYAAVPGLGPTAGYTHSTFSIDEAILARDALARVLAGERGRIVVGAAAGASCIGPGYEIVMMIDALLRKARRRHHFSLSFLTPEPFVGHFGIGGVGVAARLIADEFAERDIEVMTSVKIAEAQQDRLVLATGAEVQFDFSLVIPAFVGSGFVRSADGLANPRGFIPVTPELRSSRFDNIYAVGVAVALPPVGSTPVPVGVPKTGHLTEQMARAAAHNIASNLRGGRKVDGLDLSGTCIMDAGDTGYYISAQPFLPPRNRVIHKKGKWSRYLKLAFEKYYLARIRHDLPSLHFGW